MLHLRDHLQLAEGLAEDLSEGRIVTLTGQPSSGRSSILDLVAAQLDGLIRCVRVGADDDQTTLRAALDTLEGLASHEPTACLVDDFGRVLTTDHGVAFQGRLHALAASDPGADRIGVLLVGRLNESLTRWISQAPGSPLAAAAHRNIVVPALHAEAVLAALVADGVPAEQAAVLVDTYGAHLELIATARASVSGSAPADSLERAVYRGVAETTGATDDRLLDLARKPDEDLATTWVDELLVPLVFHPAPGRTKLVPALVAQGLPGLLIAGQAAWPGDIKSSARRFRCRLEGMVRPIWADRYHGAHLAGLIAFLDALAQRDCDVDLRLLGSETGIQGLPQAAKTMFDGRINEWAAAGLRVSWRLADYAGYELIHQRQLISPTRLAGYVLPPSDRIICVAGRIKDSDSLLPRARVALLEDAWARAAVYA